MKNTQDFTLDFESPEMDECVLKWLTEGVPSNEKKSFQRTMMFNRRFREHFCEWLKSIREPSWALHNQKKGDSQ